MRNRSKRLLSLVIVLVTVISLFPATPIQAAVQTSTTALTEQCPCGCGKALSAVSWQAWDANEVEGDPADGHYYLESDYALDAQRTIISGAKIVLDLRGHTLTTVDYGRAFLVYGYLAVLDSVGGGRLSAKTSGSGYGGVVMIATNETLGATFELFSGTVTPDADNMGSRRGGLISVAGNCIFRMHGGMLLNGTTYSTHASYVDTKDDGGSIWAAADSQTEILGGSIVGCSADRDGGSIYSQGTTILKDCQLIGGNAGRYGGNIYQTGGSLTIDNCVLSDGAASAASGNGGGNICTVSSAAVNISGGNIRNGYAAYNGGNVFLGSGNHTVSDTVISSGVCEGKGSNLACVSKSAQTTLADCDIAGDVHYVSGQLTLTGATKIGLINNGLDLISDEGTTVITANGLTEGAEIFVNAGDVFTDAGANMDYFKPAIRTVLSQDAAGLKGTQAASGEKGGYCPHCYDPEAPETVTWTEFSTTGALKQECYYDSTSDTDPACTGRHVESGHWYLTGDHTSFSQHYIGIWYNSTTAEHKDVVLDLNSYDITASGRAFYLRPKNTGGVSTLSLLDSVGGGVITGSGANTQGGGVFYNESAELAVYGGKYVYSTNTARVVRGGGVIFNGGTLNIHGGVFDGSDYDYTPNATTYENSDGETVETPYYGGAIYSRAGATRTFNMTAGRIVGGKATEGGSLYFGYNNTINITGGQITGGSAVNNGVTDSTSGTGGNIQVRGTSTYASGTLSISGCSITNGSAEVHSGNFTATYYKTINVDNCYISGGSSDDYGGNITFSANSTFATFADNIIINGTAWRGGNLYSGGLLTRVKLTDCFVADGSATTYGGNFHAGNGYLEIYGGTFAYGRAGSYGGNISTITGNNTSTNGQKNYLTIAAAENGQVPFIVGGQAGTNGGNISLQGGVLNLNAAVLQNGAAEAAGQDIYLNKKANKLIFTVGSGVTGDIIMGANAAQLGTPVYGNPVADTVCEELNANIYLENVEGEPKLCAKESTLYVGSVAVVDAAGDAQWYTTNAEAMDACDANSYIKLYTEDDLVLEKDCTVDLNGNSVNVSGDYILYGMDSSGDNYSVGTGKATWTSADAVKTGEITEAPNGNRYVALADGTAVTYHRLGMGITQMSIRPSAAGVYYTGNWKCDSTLATQVKEYGVALSVNDMPGTDFRDENAEEAGAQHDSLWTVFAGEDLVSGDPKTSVLVKNILKTQEQSIADGDKTIRTAELNQTYGEMPIYATAYITLNNGATYISDRSGNDVAHSLRTALETMDGLITSDPTVYRRFTNDLRDFYLSWKGFGMGQWSFANLNEIAEDDVIDVLMIGSSFCYYYVEELYALAEAAGIKMRVCNVYYSGCKLYQHYNWWIGNEAKYQFYETDGTGRHGTNGVSLEWCLAQGNWDVISLQESSSQLRNSGGLETHIENTKLYLDTLYPYLKDQFPQARFMWHQTWVYEIGYDRDGYQMLTAQQQAEDTALMREFSKYISQTYDVERVPSGDAWEVARTADTSLRLTARLDIGTNHAGDYYHDGDIGGGQYLNACVWFEIITGQSCVGNTYRPTYKSKAGDQYELDEALVVALQEAANKAVEEMHTK